MSDVFERWLVDNDFDSIYIENTIKVVASMINDNDFEYDNNKFDFEKCTFYNFNSLKNMINVIEVFSYESTNIGILRNCLIHIVKKFISDEWFFDENIVNIRESYVENFVLQNKHYVDVYYLLRICVSHQDWRETKDFKRGLKGGEV